MQCAEAGQYHNFGMLLLEPCQPARKPTRFDSIQERVFSAVNIEVLAGISHTRNPSHLRLAVNEYSVIRAEVGRDLPNCGSLLLECWRIKLEPESIRNAH